MRRILSVSIVVLGLAVASWAQDTNTQFCKLPVAIDQLKAKAAEVSDITLDANMIKMAMGAMKKDAAGQAEIQKMVSNIKGICVRSFKFDKGVQYSEKDVDMLRAQFSDPSWSNVVKVRKQRNGESVDVLFKSQNSVTSGIAVIVAEPEEFTFVRIEGAIDLLQLAKLGGQFGIPKLGMPGQAKPEPKLESK
jgi:hypothetical protein